MVRCEMPIMHISLCIFLHFYLRFTSFCKNMLNVWIISRIMLLIYAFRTFIALHTIGCYDLTILVTKINCLLAWNIYIWEEKQSYYFVWYDLYFEKLRAKLFSCIEVMFHEVFVKEVMLNWNHKVALEAWNMIWKCFFVKRHLFSP